MKAAYVNQTGDYYQIKISDLPVPEITNSEVLIKTSAVSVNFVDTFVRSGGFKTNLDFPFVIGRDAVGTIVKIGSAVTNFHPGDTVWTNSMGYDKRPGTTSEFVAVPSNRLFLVPDNVDIIQLVASVHSSATAAILLNGVLEVEKEHSILIEGAAGHVGTKLVQFAKFLGLSVSTTSNPNDFSKLNQLGADKTFDYHQSLNEIPEKFDYIVDTSGKVELADNLKQLKLFGQIGLITAPPSNKFSFDVRQMYTNSQEIKGFVISHAPLEQIQMAGTLLNKLFSKGMLLDDDILRLPLQQSALAHKMLENHETKQKIVITI